jgi:hypothetical protein
MSSAKEIIIWALWVKAAIFQPFGISDFVPERVAGNRDAPLSCSFARVFLLRNL